MGKRKWWQSSGVASVEVSDAVIRVLQEEKSEGVKGGMMAKRQRLGKMSGREFHRYREADVEFRSEGEWQTVDLSTPEERKLKLPNSSWKAYHNLRADPVLRESEGRLRRWPCYCPGPRGCRAQLRMPTAKERYAHNPYCVLEPMAQGLNDWKKVKFVRKQGDGDGSDESDGDEADMTTMRCCSSVRAARCDRRPHVMPMDYGLINAADAEDAAGAIDAEQRSESNENDKMKEAKDANCVALLIDLVGRVLPSLVSSPLTADT